LTGTTMSFEPSPGGDQHADYVKLIRQGGCVRHHVDLLEWLQGDMQQCLPHQILLASWGNFDEGAVHHDLVSALPGVRSYAPGTDALPFLLARFHQSWVATDRQPRHLELGDFDYFLGNADLPETFGHAMRSMRSAVVHGISDQRGGNECLYVFLSREKPALLPSGGKATEAVQILIAAVDLAFRQVALLPKQMKLAASSAKVSGDEVSVLSERETQIMAWVAMGKTNPEIGKILNISGFTVKNHMQRIFQKLNVFNRAQAVSKIRTVAVDG
jgi:transcriptional regulator EpsA